VYSALKKVFVFISNSIIYFFGWLWGNFFRLGLKLKLFYFPFVSEFISKVPFSFGWKFRRAVYHQLLPSIPADVNLHYGVKIEDRRTRFGKDVWVSSGCYIDYAIIEDYVLIGPNAILLSGGRHHRIEDPDVPIKMQGNDEKKNILIGKGAWIGAGAIVMADVGHDSIVGAGAVVTKPVVPYAVVAGNPARVLRMRKANTRGEG
jgi:acetyltransferase-like isoleucine patch superfamily enzyme